MLSLNWWRKITLWILYQDFIERYNGLQCFEAYSLDGNSLRTWAKSEKHKKKQKKKQQQCDRGAWGAEERSSRTFFNCAHTQFSFLDLRDA